ncbi:MAG: galactose-1-phosphate uridylyltransferase [Acidimicrobiales bacterium]
MKTNNQLRLDPLTGRWIAVAEGRSYRPSAFAPDSDLPFHHNDLPCPFCPGSESSSPPALETYGPSGSWTVRVVPNLYPAFDGDEPMVTTTKGPVFTQAPASGIHEVLILSQDHASGWADLDDRQLAVVMSAIRDRMDAHAHSKVIRYSQVIVNHGRSAGASMEHPHGQLLGISFVPRELSDEQAGFARFVGGCVLCATIELERTAGSRMICDNDEVIVIAPYWSAVPFEMLVIPTSHSAHLHLSSPSTLGEVGSVINRALRMLREATGHSAYNLVFHSSPYRAFGNFHWHVHILPKLTTKAGFELGTGVAINIVSPEDAAQTLTGSPDLLDNEAI